MSVLVKVDNACEIQKYGQGSGDENDANGWYSPPFTDEREEDLENRLGKQLPKSQKELWSGVGDGVNVKGLMGRGQGLQPMPDHHSALLRWETRHIVSIRRELNEGTRPNQAGRSEGKCEAARPA